jgi:hypothetical protein
MSPKLTLTPTSPLAIGATPRADLLPPEIKLRAKLREQRRLMLGALVVIVIIVAGGYGAATVLAQNRASALADARDQTLTILQQQKQYAEVNKANTDIAAAKAARIAGTTTEIDWKTEIAAVVKTLPAGSTLTSMTITSSTPTAPIAAPSSPLEGERVAEFQLAVKTGDIPDTAKWIRDLSSLTGFVDATPTTVAAAGAGSSGAVTTSLILHLNKNIYWNRFTTEATK